MKKVSCILVAAGLSRRMQGLNKLLLEIGGEALVARIAAKLCAAGFEEVVAVTGHDAAKVQEKLKGLPLSYAHNPDYQRGLHSSIRAGLENLQKPHEGVMICLADQPDLSLRDILTLIDNYRRHAGAHLVYPVYRGERGSPVIIDNRYRDEILAEMDGDHGIAYLFSRHPKATHAVQMPNDSVVRHIDRMEDYMEFNDRI